MSAVKTQRVLEILIGVCVAVLAWVVVDTFREKVVVAGDTAPDFTITADNGRTFSRTNFGGKLLVLNFWASWCAPCIEETPSLDKLQKMFADQGVVVLAVSIDQSPQAYQTFVSKMKPSFVTARDPEARISSDYGTFKVPETYIINREGKVLEKVISNRDWTDPSIVSAVKAMLAS